MPKQKIRIKLKGFDHKILDQSAQQIVEAVAKAFADAVAQHMIRRLVALVLKEQGK